MAASKSKDTTNARTQMMVIYEQLAAHQAQSARIPNALMNQFYEQILKLPDIHGEINMTSDSRRLETEATGTTQLQQGRLSNWHNCQNAGISTHVPAGSCRGTDRNHTMASTNRANLDPRREGLVGEWAIFMKEKFNPSTFEELLDWSNSARPRISRDAARQLLTTWGVICKYGLKHQEAQKPVLMTQDGWMSLQSLLKIAECLNYTEQEAIALMMRDRPRRDGTRRWAGYIYKDPEGEVRTVWVRYIDRQLDHAASPDGEPYAHLL